MFPHMMNNDVNDMIDRYKDAALGWKLSGAGGGGYLVLIADQTIEGSFQIQIRRK
jgi:galactokinase/mevalonate kinase-like predicted kinase